MPLFHPPPFYQLSQTLFASHSAAVQPSSWNRHSCVFDWPLPAQLRKLICRTHAIETIAAFAEIGTHSRTPCKNKPRLTPNRCPRLAPMHAAPQEAAQPNRNDSRPLSRFPTGRFLATSWPLKQTAPLQIHFFHCLPHSVGHRSILMLPANSPICYFAIGRNAINLSLSWSK